MIFSCNIMPEKIFRFSLIILIPALGLFLLGILTGPGDMTLLDAWQALLGQARDPIARLIVWQIRLPRVILAAEAGAALSIGGLVLQTILQNPLSEPYILGISGGASVGAILGLICGLPQGLGLSLPAFVGACLATFFVLFWVRDNTSNEDLLLIGVMVNAFCSAIILFLISTIHNSKLHGVIFWLIGHIPSSSLNHSLLVGLMLLPCLVITFLFSHCLNIMLLGREQSLSMGLRYRFISITVLVIVSVMTGIVVSNCGLLGFVGLTVPHLLRILFGYDHRILIPMCVICGSSYMVLCDLVARTIYVNQELPVGVFTAAVGAPLFIFLLKKTKLSQ